MDVQRLIGEVAKRHNVLLGPSDPILVTLTLNELVLAQYVERLTATLEQAEDRTAAGSAQQIAAARELAGKLVTETGGYVAGQVEEAGRAVHAQLIASLGRQVQAAQEAAQQASMARRTALYAALVAVGAVCCLSGLLVGAIAF
ncbi:hypothetical protein E6C67_02940 (plasmid) [Azospirillum sp. TSA2s]|uniref:hypothetical protein n=1 Tax=Azospirillum sp. TSA2s TaxID=709810 RepID=UPI0010AA5586|nr:hypothetical protein [Azospirillum sp. TSA2s]QCG92924.1 hypothetical protein E6C67_02940 [Azospirillum sp. TSA2s]